MSSEDEFDKVVRKRQQEAQREEEQRRETARAEGERQAQMLTHILNFQGVAANLISAVIQARGRLHGIGDLDVRNDPRSCRVIYTKLGGGGRCSTASLSFVLQDTGEVEISSTFGHSDTKRWAELTYQVLDQKLKEFLTAALA